MKIICHDGTPFIDIQCPHCAYIMHLHQGQLPPDYPDCQLFTICHKCGAILVIPQPIPWIPSKPAV